MRRGARIGLRRAAAALLLALAACAPPEGEDGIAGPARFLGAIRVDDVTPGDAGLSGLAVTPDGRRVTMIDDRSFAWEARVRRDGMRPDRLGRVRRIALRRPDGRPMYGLDSEGLHVLPDGTLAVSYEGFHRILLHRPPDWRSEVLEAPTRLLRLPRNKGVEALAGAPDGTLYAVAEGRERGRHPLWRVSPDGRWTALAPVAAPGRFRPVGADIGPDGRFYLLERRFGPLPRFATRVRSFRIGPDGLADPRTVLLTAPGRFGNFEGIALWRDRQGRLRLLLVSDDNGWDWLAAELAEFVLPAEGPGPAEAPGEGGPTDAARTP